MTNGPGSKDQTVDHPHGADVGREEPPERADIIVHSHWRTGYSNQHLDDGTVGAG
jgi:hypothetical protein